MVELYDHQLKAVEQLRNGSILCGGVGTGKSRTAIAYYVFKVCDGEVPVNGKGQFRMMNNPMDLYIITTAKKRDSNEWESECYPFNLSDDQDDSISGVSVTIDSWNNIKKYIGVSDAFFIFDEQRVVGKGAWVKSFLKITRKNKWILLSATPGDTWSDYIPVFIANGFYANRTEFNDRHCVFNRFARWPQIDRYIDVGLLVRHRNQVLVSMDVVRETVPHHIYTTVGFDKPLYLTVARDRWDPFEDAPIAETGKLCYLMRQVVNSDRERIEAVNAIFSKQDTAIVFYNFNYELDMLRESFTKAGITFSEWNGQKHEPVPDGRRWAYLVQYLAGAEGWNCITTDTIVFYSLNYSYRVMIQAEGRIDRLNTPYKDLYYYHIISRAPIDVAIQRALKKKKNFNERSFLGI